MITVLVVDHQPAVRQRLRQQLLVEPDLDIVGEAATATAALSFVEERHPNVVVMEIELDPVDGLMTASRIRQIAPQTAVVIHTMHSDDHTRARAQALGAAAFVVKGDVSTELPAAIRLADRLRIL